MTIHRIECFAEDLHDTKMSLYRDSESYTDLIIAQAFDLHKPPTTKEEPMIAAATVTTAKPESIRHIPDKMDSAQLRHFAQLLGIESEMKVVAASGMVDMTIIDAALSKTKLTIEDRLKAKIIMFGSGFTKRRG
jgi:hypothetical protein